ncbi:MAG TPA: hypothetical protein VKZ18_09925 [Polyangia bacterium]|nr:hypothetical protein [Polyangia bacterium]
MIPVSRATVRCTRCRAFGVLPEGGVCPICEGAGDLPRLIVPLKIVAAADLVPAPDMAFRRLAVMLSEHTDDGRVVVRGVTDQGLGLVASLPEARFREIAHVEFLESGVGWSP